MMGHLTPTSGVSLLFCSLIVVVISGSMVAGSSGNDGGYSSIEEILPSSLVLPQISGEVHQVLFATGVQIYLYNGTAWNLNNVSADLYNLKGLKIGYHYFLGELDSNGGRATWETYSPYSRVTGKQLASVSQEDSIAWLLLEATSNRGKTFLGLTNFIQRVFTQHGLPPSADDSCQVGQIFESNYTSLYIFST